MVIKIKRDCFKTWYKNRSEDNFGVYKLASKEAKRAMSEGEYKAYDMLSTKLGPKEGEKDIYILVKARERKRRDLGGVNCIKDDDNKVLVMDDEIKE